MSQPNLIPGLPEREGASFQPSRLERLRSLRLELGEILEGDLSNDELFAVGDIRDDCKMRIRDEVERRSHARGAPR